jgi:ADP-ribose pyrophosphatase
VAVGETLLELPAGTLEEGEEPVVTARRELTEETGYSAEHLRHLHSFWMSPGILRERMHLFVATELRAGEMRPDAGEQIAPIVVSWQEAIALVRDGKIQDAKTLVALLYYESMGRPDYPTKKAPADPP